MVVPQQGVGMVGGMAVGGMVVPQGQGTLAPQPQQGKQTQTDADGGGKAGAKYKTGDEALLNNNASRLVGLPLKRSRLCVERFQPEVDGIVTNDLDKFSFLRLIWAYTGVKPNQSLGSLGCKDYDQFNKRMAAAAAKHSSNITPARSNTY